MSSVKLTNLGLEVFGKKYSDMERTERMNHICRQCNISRPTFYRILGREFIRLDTLQKLFSCLKISDDIIGDGYACEISDGAVAFVQAKKTHLNWIVSAEGLFFGTPERMQQKLLECWYEINPNGFYVFLRRDEIIGAIVVIPVRHDAMILLSEGTILERDLDGQHIYPENEQNQAQDLYIESLIINEVHRETRGMILTKLLREHAVLLRSVCVLENLRMVYAVAASDGGRALLENLQFEHMKTIVIPESHTRSGRQKQKQRDVYAIEYRRILGRAKTLRNE